EVIEKRVVTIGLLDKNSVHPREVFADVIADRAAAVIFAHNHPSGDLQPSEAVMLLAAKHGARNIRVFGSVSRGEPGPESDVDHA
ncbi:MAG: hypothetical protein KKG96_09175, partial [Proteobacteria bacterium]|nr:hypothetical protein [Pseudomonadota bacterium]MBU1964726.1 hypothetical protein [Pseudomonadota bacterium]